ncbi:hypothetical protein SRB5_49900 [Streptomyces sp. RB5]|uniref:HTH luxR-type domain-containing protein n=1 Tax=Streptomyces smaragdinus TaxID=2585196 RepID=A0A7K0CPZ3_9ACTN|nr:helix-turn-helix transcriptional regulator [Streptomyces smaragdinus]MQY14814.1 hypothetical protein [Streptomyces smaragdinus]
MDLTTNPWAAAGLDPLAGRVLEYLVTVPSADVTETAAAVGATQAEARTALRLLADASLALRTDGDEPRWAAGPPRSSLGAVLGRRRAELARAEGLVERLQDMYETVSAPRTARLVEVLEREEEVAVRYAQLLKATSTELLHLAKPPYVTGPHGPADGFPVPDGLRMRSVYETDGFTNPLSLVTAERGMVLGGELRLASRLPMKLVVFDRTAALLPMSVDRPAAGSLVVHSPALVTSLVALFESLWEAAEPVCGGEDEGPGRRTREILRLMATGMKDETIARVLKVSRRTVQKHVSDAGTLLGAKTRFQIALLAAERGWLKDA